MRRLSPIFLATTLAVVAVANLAVAPADARRGGSFGSRGARTYAAPRSYDGARYAPVQRSMAARPAPTAQSYNPGFSRPAPAPARSRFGGFGGGLLGGLLAGGLIGHFLGGGMGVGGGLGAGGGMLASLIQIAILGAIVWLVIGWFRRRSEPVGRRRNAAGVGSGGAGLTSGFSASPPSDEDEGGAEILVTAHDHDAFERLLIDVQAAFGREDYSALRHRTTPEVMSYLAEELSANATRGVRNEVSGTRLIDAQVLEAWQEGEGDYATISLHYENVDVLRDRATGQIAEGSTDQLTETTELWTFYRDADGPWKLSAIQEQE